MFYEGKEHILLVNFAEDINDPTPDSKKIIIPILNKPYNLLIYHEGKAKLCAMDYDTEQIYNETPCVLSPTERENIMRLYYPLP